MNRLLSLVLLLAPFGLFAQPITWITPCANDTFCLNQGNCSEGNVFMVQKANTSCFAGPFVNYSYRIDLFNDGSLDIQSSQDTVTGTYPLGTHQVTWRATDNCGNLSSCTYLFTIKDCLPPNLICISNLSQNLDLGCFANVPVSAFVQNVSDNCTPSNELEFGIREAGTGTGFPNETSLDFDECDLGPHSLQIWAKDENGLTSICNTTVDIQDNAGICICATNVSIDLKGCARSAGGARLDNYTMRGELTSGTLQLFVQESADSCYDRQFYNLQPGSNYKITVRARRSGGWLNGVTTFDLLQTSKHILNIQPFHSAYQRVAADVNASNSVTTFDIVETRKLILGLYDTLPLVPSWRLVQPVANPADILSAVKDTYSITLNGLLNDTTLTGLDFIGIKLGDTNLSATFTGAPDDRSALLLHIEDRFLNAGETMAIPIRFAETTTLKGWQMALKVDPALAEIEGEEGLPDEDFSILRNEIRALWFDAEGKEFSEGENVFSLKIKVLQPASLSQILTLENQNLIAEAYAATESGQETRHPLLLGFHVKNENAAIFFPPRPNPFNNETTFIFNLKQPSAVRLEVFDVSGKRVFETNSKMNAGVQTLVLQDADLPGKGAFFYRVQANAEVFSGRLVRH